VIGGRLIEIVRVCAHYDRFLVESGPIEEGCIVRLWMIEPQMRNSDELCVYARAGRVNPKLGDSIWCSGGRVLFDYDRHFLVKIGFTFRPQHQQARAR